MNAPQHFTVSVATAQSFALSPEGQSMARRRLLRDARETESRAGLPGETTALLGELMRRLVVAGLAELPAPGQGRTLARWQALADVAAHDLSLAKLFEGHTDALAILRELGDDAPVPAGSTWGMWAAEPPDAKVSFQRQGGGHHVRLQGRKSWCSGASTVSNGLLTAWAADGCGPFLVKVAMDQSGVRVIDKAWRAVGMAGSASVDVEFDAAQGTLLGGARDYLSRPGFWHGGAGIAACWYGGALALAHHLKAAAADSGGTGKRPGDLLRQAALGKVDLALRQTAALLRDAARWIDEHPRDDACALALRVRLSAEASAGRVLDEVGRALGAGPFCRDAQFARMAADLPVFVRQSGADRDFAALGAHLAASESASWAL